VVDVWGDLSGGGSVGCAVVEGCGGDGVLSKAGKMKRGCVAVGGSGSEGVCEGPGGDELFEVTGCGESVVW